MLLDGHRDMSEFYFPYPLISTSLAIASEPIFQEKNSVSILAT